MMNIGRAEAFSDGVMAIIITIMAFSIPLPETFDVGGILELLRMIGIFFVSFFVVGAQWVKHHYLLSRCKEMTGQMLWQNILYLFFLSLMPLFTKWMMLNPSKAVPAIGYDLLFFLLTLSFHFLQNSVLKGMGREIVDKIKERRGFGDNRIMFGAGAFVLLGAFGLSFKYPAVSIVFFIGLPVISSLVNLIVDRKDLREKHLAHSGRPLLVE